MYYVVCDVVEPGQLPEHCIHGQATCMGGCDEWVWLGNNSLDGVLRGDYLPICGPCAIKAECGPESLAGTVNDHRRVDGPHD